MSQAYPLSWPLGWPRTKNPTWSQFGKGGRKPSVSAATSYLWEELRKMGVNRLILSTNLKLKNDGWPRSDQKEPQDRGAAVYFDVDKKPTVLACDKWSSVGENIWAIAKHIEALRGQDRWGVGSLKQAFAGYTALPQKTEDSWREVLEIEVENPNGEQIVAAYRRLAKIRHPDMVGGSAEAFDRLKRAMDNAIQWREANK